MKKMGVIPQTTQDQSDCNSDDIYVCPECGVEEPVDLDAFNEDPDTERSYV
jgi:hypothetical protein